MTKLRIVPFEPVHYLEATKGWPVLVMPPEESAVIYAKAGPAWTGLVDNAVAACAGVAIQYAGVGEAWAVWTPLGRQHLRDVHRAVRKGLVEIIASHGLRRIEARILVDFWAGRLWAQHLGFEFESTMAKAAPGGADFVMYVLLRDQETT